MGYPADGTGIIQPGSAVPLQLPTARHRPAADDRRRARDQPRLARGRHAPAAGAADRLRRPNTYNNATSLTVYDAKGQDVALTYYFQKAGNDNWNVYATANGTHGRRHRRRADAADDDQLPGQRQRADRAGRRRCPSTSRPRPTRSARRRWPITGMLLDLTGATQFGAAFGVTNMTQDGYAPGR